MTPGRTNLRKRLWIGGSGIALFLVTLIVAAPFLDRSPDDGKLWLGHDFLPAYVAGRFARGGVAESMYDRTAFLLVQVFVAEEAKLDLTGQYVAALNPPHFALLFAPLSALPYRTAAALWAGINLAFYVASIVLLVRLLPPDARRDWKTWALIPLLATISMPFLQAAGHLQNTFLSLLILATTVTLWRRRRGFAAGAVLGLLFYKPQLACVIALVLVADLGRRAVLGLGFTGVALLLLTVLLMPRALGAYFHSLPSNLDWIQNQPTYNWARQVTVNGFAHFLHAPPVAAGVLWITAAGAGVIALARVAHNGTPASRDRLIAATVAATPLLIPYCLDYDLLLLAVPAVLFAGEVLTRPARTRADRAALRAWVALYAWLYANPALSGLIKVSLTVPLLAALAVALLLRSAENKGEGDTNDEAELLAMARPGPAGHRAGPVGL